ncbi:hypothetical protein Taro_002190 [Colocasia esculenta]|uniref:Uncharacterized protein n=1 Tax=Colocasia esculenta TaxID=4460 RepID=A0A843TGK1_COLES|nr:hypothetical protein [Colocasia esculenta]
MLELSEVSFERRSMMLRDRGVPGGTAPEPYAAGNAVASEAATMSRRCDRSRRGRDTPERRVKAEFPPSVFTSRVVVTMSSRTEFPTVRLLNSGRARAGRRRRGGSRSPRS